MTNKNDNRANKSNAKSDVEYSKDINIRSEITKKDMENKKNN